MAQSKRDEYLGMENTNNQGCRMKIVEYYNSDNITVQFEDGTIVKNKRVSHFKERRIMNPNMDYASTEAHKIASNRRSNVENSWRTVANKYNIPQKGFEHFCKTKLKDNKLSKDEMALKYIEYKKSLNIKGKCKELNISYSAIRNYARRNNITVEDGLKHYMENEILKDKRGQLKRLCELNNLDYEAVRRFKHKYCKGCTNVQSVIDAYNEYNKEKTPCFNNKCRKAGLGECINTVTKYKNRHTELSDNQVICKYNPNCYINILGQLVITQEDGTKIFI